jgi:hypothetical protein
MRKGTGRLGRAGLRLAGPALGLLLAGAAWGAAREQAEGPRLPSYAIPNIVALAMCLVVLAIPCKRFRRV